MTYARITMTHRLNERLLGELEKDPETVWSTECAAAFLGLSPETLRKWRRGGEGPEYIRLSLTKVGYQKRALLIWVRARAYHSTSAVPTAEGSEGGAS